MDYKEKIKNARAFIVLLAALIALLLNMKYERELVESLIIVLIVIIVFYFISTFALFLVDKIRNMDSTIAVDIEDEASEEDSDTDNDNEE